jgi:hypothetical protein
MRLFIAPAIALLAAAVPAIQADAATFQDGGYTYSYTAQALPHGRTLISGTIENTAKPFTLTVHGRYVEGTVANNAVSFTVSRATAAQLVNEVNGAQKLASN